MTVDDFVLVMWYVMLACGICERFQVDKTVEEPCASGMVCSRAQCYSKFQASFSDLWLISRFE